MSKTVITDVRCIVCKKSIAQSWVYRNGPRLLCPDCGITYDWPYRTYGAPQCAHCHAEPAFMTGTDDANHPTYYCTDCVAEMAHRGLERAEKTTPASTYVVIGSVLLAAGALLAGFGVWEAVRGSGGAWCVFVLAFVVIIYGLDYVLRRKELASKSSERAASVRRIRDSIDATPMTTWEKLALFGMEPGGPLRCDYADQAIKHFEK